MSLTVTHLNADSTFLLVFRPAAAPTAGFPPSPGYLPVAFSILLDPWLVGHSTVISSRFSVTRHTIPACVSSLRDLPSPPDLVIVSQDKPDHCHEETLRQLDPNGDGNNNGDGSSSGKPSRNIFGIAKHESDAAPRSPCCLGRSDRRPGGRHLWRSLVAR